MYSFDNRSVTDINICDGDGYIVFNANINNESIREIFREYNC